MLVLVATLVFAALGAAENFEPRQFCEARGSFSAASLYLHKKLPDKNLTYLEPKHRPSLSLGLLAGLVGEVALLYKRQHKYKPLEVLQDRLPYLWRNYRSVSSKIRENLETALLDVYPILNLIDTLCIGVNDLHKCNVLVDGAVKKKPELYEKEAELLLEIGKLSNDLNELTLQLNDVIDRNEEIPTFVKYCNNGKFVKFVKDLANLHSQLKTVSQFRQGN